MSSSIEIVQDFIESKKAVFQGDLKQQSGFRITRRYSDLMDRFIRALFSAAGFSENFREIQDEGLAIMALGSYGRRELCYGSDVDLLVLHKGRLSPEMDRVIPKALYPLWDAKLEVGHSVLTVHECVRLAIQDFRFLTSILDARFLLGSRPFYRLFKEALRSKVDREKGSLLKQLLVHQEKRKERYSDEGYFIEPDIKEGPGGLRDIHMMSWIARIYFKSDHLYKIRRFPVFSHFRSDRLGYSKGFLFKVRNRLHLLTERKEDRLLIPLQQEISHYLGYKDSPLMTGAERFMRDIYQHLNRIRYGREEFFEKALDLIDPRPFEYINETLPPMFRVMKGKIVLEDDGLLKADPLLIIKGIVEANRRGLFLGSGFIWEASKIIRTNGKRLLNQAGSVDLFLDFILKPANPEIFRLSLEIGLLTLFIPEFKRIRNRVQFGFYHMETVDLHSLKTLEVLNRIGAGGYDNRWPLFKAIFKELEHPEWLYLAGLLHDIGKGYLGDHSVKGADLAPRILKRLAVEEEALEMIPFLIRHHLLLIHASQKRDLNDEKTSVQVAQTVKNPEILKHVFLLTIADSLATGPMASSDWKIMLIIELFFKVKHILERGVLASPDATNRIQEVKGRLCEHLKPHFPEESILSLLDQVSARYFVSVPLDVIMKHVHLALTMGTQRLAMVLEKLRDAPVTRVILCTYDKPGLFSKMVGVFTINNIKVLSANIFTLKNGLAFDVYEVTNPLDIYRESERWDKIQREILLALDDGLSLDNLVQQKRQTVFASHKDWSFWGKRVRLDNSVSDFFTVIEVSSGDRAGLLFELAKAIFSLDLDIRFAKVNGDREKMSGVFYICDAEGQKVYEEDQIKKIEAELMNVIK